MLNADPTFKDPLLLVDIICSPHQSLQMKAEQRQAPEMMSGQSECDEHICDSKDPVKVELMSYLLGHKS